MRLLLDTHVAIWALSEPQRLPEPVRTSILDAEAVLVSAASIWEISLKHGLQRASAPPFGSRQALEHFKDAGFDLLPVSAAHAAFVETLPPIHADPFDRILVAQAICENLPLVTADKAVAAYSASFINW